MCARFILSRSWRQLVSRRETVATAKERTRGSFKTPRKHGPIKGYGPLGKRENSAAYAGVPVRLVIGRGAGPTRAGSPDRCNLFASLVAKRV